MQFNFQNSKLTNFFFFVSNLSEWHYSANKAYSEQWLKDNKLSFQEKRALDRISCLLKKHGFGSKYLGRPFFKENETAIWQQMKNLFGQKEYEELKIDFDNLKPRFENHWMTESKKLNKWKRELESNFSSFFNDCDILNDLATFYRTPVNEDTEVKIFLLMSAVNWCGGSANIEPGIITLECSGIKLNKRAAVFAVIIHELIHAFFESNYLYSLLEKYDDYPSKAWPFPCPMKKLVKELVTSALFPEGYLAEKYLGINIKKQNKKSLELFKDSPYSIPYIKAYSNLELYERTKEYIENGRPLDDAYLQKVSQVIRQLISEKRAA